MLTASASSSAVIAAVLTRDGDSCSATKSPACTHRTSARRSAKRNRTQFSIQNRPRLAVSTGWGLHLFPRMEKPCIAIHLVGPINNCSRIAGRRSTRSLVQNRNRGQCRVVSDHLLGCCCSTNSDRLALAIELSSTGFANSRIRAPLHVHPRSPGSRPSLCRGLNEEFYKKVRNKKVTGPGRSNSQFKHSLN